MIDSLCKYQEKALQLPLMKKLGLTPKKFVLMTMHRPANVDEAKKLETILDVIEGVSRKLPVVFPIHPRTAKSIQKYGLDKKLKAIPNLTLLPPQGYLEFLNLMNNSALIITDSGGIQEESTFLQVPCLTIRDTTERPITITLGTNILIPDLDAAIIIDQFEKTILQERTDSEIPPLWDGRAAIRIVNHLLIEHQFLTPTNKKIAPYKPILNA